MATPLEHKMKDIELRQLVFIICLDAVEREETCSCCGNVERILEKPIWHVKYSDEVAAIRIDQSPSTTETWYTLLNEAPHSMFIEANVFMNRADADAACVERNK